jgi:hypothetical protein
VALLPAAAAAEAWAGAGQRRRRRRAQYLHHRRRGDALLGSSLSRATVLGRATSKVKVVLNACTLVL